MARPGKSIGGPTYTRIPSGEEDVADENETLSRASRHARNVRSRSDDPHLHPSYTSRHRPSFTLLPQLEETEKEFFDRVQSGDESTVIEFLQVHPHFNVNCQDYESNSPLHLAVYNGDYEMVELLLRRGVHVADTHLHAIKVGNLEILLLLLNKLQEIHPETEYRGCPNSAEFTNDVTPLILAAQCDDYDIIKLLIERGHTIRVPHKPDCTCKELCKNLKKKENLSTSLRRINTYRAMASPAYLSQLSSDPILSAFRLSAELETCADAAKEFQVEYLNLAEKLKMFPTDLLDLCRTTEEIMLLLNQTEGAGKGAKRAVFPRILIAFDTEQKMFVAHPNCQQVLYMSWLGDWGDWKSLPYTHKVIRIIPQVLFLPLMAVMYWIAPRNKFVKGWRSPIAKFISNVSSYVMFLILLFLESQLYHTGYSRGPPDTGLEYPLIFWVFGFIFNDMERLYHMGRKKYFKSMWNWYEVTMTTCFLANFLMWLWSYLDVKWHGNQLLERKYWHEYDPALIGEAFFALSTVQAFFKAFYMFQIQQHLGPLQISLAGMTKDIVIFLCLFMLVVTSFATGLNRLYSYYAGMSRIEGEGRRYQLGSFTSFSSTFKTLYWSIFALSPVESADVIIENLGNDTVPIINHHSVTQGVGYILFGLYHAVVIIVFLNMLIAMMANTFQKVQDNADVEWKYTRAKVWMDYMQEGSVLPSPFNLVPSPHFVAKTFAKFWADLTNIKIEDTFCFGYCFDEEDLESKVRYDKKSLASYQVLMSQLVQRYIKRKKREADTEPVTKKQLDLLFREIKNVNDRVKFVAETVHLLKLAEDRVLPVPSVNVQQSSGSSL